MTRITAHAESQLKPTGIQKLLECTSVKVRLEMALRVIKSARDVLKLRQMLKNLADKRESSEGSDDQGGPGAATRKE